MKFHVFIHENMKFYHRLSKQTTTFEYSSLSVRLLLLRAHELSWLLKFLILQEKLHFVTLLSLKPVSNSGLEGHLVDS